MADNITCNKQIGLNRSLFFGEMGVIPLAQALLADIVKAVAAYEPTDLLTAVGGLQLIPENAERAIRLEALAHAIASLPNDPNKPAISPHRLRTILNVSPLGNGPIVQEEDPFNNPFTEAFTFFGGSYVVFPGITEEATFILRHLATAVFLHPKPFPNKDFVTLAYRFLLAVLVLSDEIARRAGMGRGVEPIERPDKKVIVPDAKRFAQLKRAVDFDSRELSDLFAERGIELAALNDLILPLGGVNKAYFEVGSGELLVKPIVQADERFIVAIPGVLLSAARNGLVSLAINLKCQDELAERYNSAVWSTVGKSFGYLKNERIPISFPRPSSDITWFRESVFSLDTDKVVYTMLITDSLEDYDPKHPFGQWQTDKLGPKIEERLSFVESQLMQRNHPPNEILLIVLMQSVGRWHVQGFNRPSEPLCSLFLCMTAGDVETIALLEGGNPLALWKYARASWELRKRTEIIVYGELDEFYVYRKRGHNYYLSDEAKPDVLSIGPDGSGELRLEVIRQRDFHAAVSYDIGGIIEVTTLHDTSSIPLYTPLGNLGKRVTLLVEGLPLPVWIVGPENSDAEQTKLHNLYEEFADAIGYWLWQFTPSLGPIMHPLCDLYERLLLKLELPVDETLYQIRLDETGSDVPPIETGIDKVNGVVKVTLNPSVTTVIEGPDNSGERLLMRHILNAIGELLSAQCSEKLSEETVASILDQYAPLGMKKYLLFLDTASAPDLDPTGLPPVRKVQEADENNLLDELGAFLEKAGIPTGEIPSDRRNEVLNDAVGFYYHELQRLVSSLSPDGLLEWLVAYNESIVQELSSHRLTIPTRLACFGSEAELVKLLNEELPSLTKAALASRFVIEYVVARPPNGFRPMSLAVYDKLQALASNLIETAFMSDIVRFNLADIRLTMLRSGRLGTDREQMARAREAFLPIFSFGEIVRTTKIFKSRWARKEHQNNEDAGLGRIDAAGWCGPPPRAVSSTVPFFPAYHHSAWTHPPH